MPGPRRAPRPPVLQILHTLLLLRHAPHQAFLDLRERYGDLVRIPGPPGPPVFLVSHPRFVKHVLVDQYRRYQKSSHLRRIREEGFGNGLVNSEGELWQRQRRTLQAPFHGPAIERFANGIEVETDATQRRWQEAAARGQPLDIEAEMLDLFTRITERSLFGQPLGDVVGSARRAFLRAARTPPFLSDLPGPARWDLSRKTALLRRTVAEVIRLHRPEQSEAILGELALIRDPLTGLAMSENQLVDEMVTLLYTALETSAMSLTWFWYVISRDRRTEEAIRREQTHLPNHQEPHRDLLGAALSEVLRLYPPSWAIGRVAVDPDEIDGCEIPAGSRLILSQYVVHRHPDFWPHPEEFRPERFLSKAAGRVSEFSYFPFGAGSRVCLGRELALMETRNVAARLLERFRLHPTSQDPVGVEATVTLKPRTRLRMIVEALP